MRWIEAADMLDDHEVGVGCEVPIGAAMHPSMGATFRLTEAMTVSEAFKLVGQAHARAVLESLSVLTADSGMEALHQSRLSARRLRAIFSLFKSTPRYARMEHVPAELKWISDLLGSAREYDVLLHRIIEPIAAGNPDVIGFEPLLRSFRTLRQRAHAAVLAGLRTDRIAHLGLELERGLGERPDDWLPVWASASGERENAAAFITTALQTRLQAFLGDGHNLAGLEHTQQHRMRVRAKKLRYMIEAVGELLPGRPTGEVIRLLRDFQDALGDVNDGRVSRVLILGCAGSSLARKGRERSWLVAAGVAASESIRHEEWALSKAQTAYDELARLVQPFPGARSPHPPIARP